MSVQTTYSETLSPGSAGAIANAEPKTLVSRVVETAGGIPFGTPVTQGTADIACRSTQSGDTQILGISVRDQSVPPEASDRFAENTNALIITSGVIWVEAAANLNAGDDVWVTVADGTFTNTDAGGGATVTIAGARWDTSATSGNLAKLRLA